MDVSQIRGRVWLDEKSFFAMRWSVWYKVCVQGYLEISDGRSVIHIHSSPNTLEGNTTTLDFVNKLKAMLVMLDRFIKINPKKESDFVLRTWLNPSDSHYSGNMVVYLKRVEGEYVNMGLKMSCCSQTISFSPHDAKSFKRSTKIAKKIAVQITKMLDAIDLCGNVCEGAN